MDQSGSSSSVNLNEFQDFMLLHPSTDMREMVNFWQIGSISTSTILIFEKWEKKKKQRQLHSNSEKIIFMTD
ncbi:hypothetical protein CAEBREN_00986 [Caenorhabditis brenneri]|uniref:Uncharacterized protein n=1 Tax=Caenorhabditis brenneri TaxID=135651 RepID=G0NID6_CAEBE|nr:hypothetical protein CAEBREN_00986 [Caenorhabditis brenneri]